MGRIAIGFGLALVAVGLAGYFGTGTKSLTALIPAGLGLALIALGALASRDRLRMHVMHAAALLGLLGLVGCAVMAVPKLPALLREGHVTRADGTDATGAVLSQTATALLCGVFVALCVKSFIDARRPRRAGGPGGPPA
jgi:hypothetical protein